MLGRFPATIDSPEAYADVDPDVDQAEYARFLEEARQAARQKLGHRWAVTVVATDRQGLVADVAEALLDLRFNVEAASHATVAGATALSFVVSAERGVLAAELAERLDSVPGVEPDRTVYVPLRGGAHSVPDKTYTLWHIRGQAPEAPGVLHHVTKALASPFGAVLVRFVTLALEDGTCATHLNVALPPSAEVTAVAQALKEAYLEVRGELVDFRDVPAPVESSLSWHDAPHATLRGTTLLSIVAEAKSGLIATVTGRLADAGFSIRGSSMAILEGRTVAVFALAGPDTNTARIDAAIEPCIDDLGLNHSVFIPPQTLPKAPDATQILHFYCLVPERKGVLATVARTFADAGVNIERLASRVIGQDSTACVINMFVTLPQQAEIEDLKATLEVAIEGAISLDLERAESWEFSSVY